MIPSIESVAVDPFRLEGWGMRYVWFTLLVAIQIGSFDWNVESLEVKPMTSLPVPLSHFLMVLNLK